MLACLLYLGEGRREGGRDREGGRVRKRDTHGGEGEERDRVGRLRGRQRDRESEKEWGGKVARDRAENEREKGERGGGRQRHIQT